MIQPKTSYARNGDVNIAYQIIGDGPLDLLFIPAFVSHLDLCWAAPETAAFFRRLASFSRLILFDKRGTGLSDPVSGVATLEERMEDVRAVLDACGSQQAALFGLSEGGPMSLLFAATYPERTTALVMFGSFARLMTASDYFLALDEEWKERLALWTDAVENHWGEGRALALYMPTLDGDANAQRMLGMFERAAASPTMVRALQQFNIEIDVRHVLPVIGVPTLVLHRTDDLMPVELGRYVAEHVPGALFVELPGNDHMPWLGDSDAVLDEVEQFLTGTRRGTEPDRVLATVLFTDIARSTERAADLGDKRWRALLENHNELVRHELAAFSGREVKMLGDGFLATFDGPGRAILCACAIREDLGSLGIDVCAGVHTGECEVIGADIGGMAVHIGARVAARAAPGEVLVSSAVRDLVVGSGIEFADRGTHELKGVPGKWQLLAVAGARTEAEPVVAVKTAGDRLAPNATLITKGDRAALRLARRAPGVARLVSRMLSRRAQPQETHP
ncbi:MAG: adenylate/guanylate cyclase protein [Solirubrobacterales bacterium]|nr:adenylate/guanylate cyclase protein [Solirubrobacterales bacterium]